MKKRHATYKPKLPEYLLNLVREFRKRPTKAEAMLWGCLRERRLNGAKFRRQHPIGRYIADYYCHAARLVIELGGGIHDEHDQREYDQIRQQEIEARELTVLRFRNEHVTTDLERVLQEIADHLPSPTGRGARGEG